MSTPSGPLISSRITVNSEGLKKSILQFSDMKDYVKIVNNRAARITNILKGRTPVSKDPLAVAGSTGNLKKSWGYYVVSGQPKQNAIRMQVYNSDPRAAKLLKFLVSGTKAHTITGKNSPLKMLRFWSRKYKDVFFTHTVRHPGTKPYPGLGKQASLEVGKEINAMMADIRSRAKNALEGK